MSFSLFLHLNFTPVHFREFQFFAKKGVKSLSFAANNWQKSCSLSHGQEDM
jgi:hypothetical protein